MGKHSDYISSLQLIENLTHLLWGKQCKFPPPQSLPQSSDI